MTKSKKITYVFLEGRAKRMDNSYPNDFFYFFKHFEKEDAEIKYLESNEIKNVVLNLNLFFYLIDKFIRKATALPFYAHKFLSRKNRYELKKTDYLILTNETVGYSLLIYLIYLKLIKSSKVIIFVMGLFNLHNKSIFKNIILKMILWRYDKFIFLSNNEFKYALKNFRNKESKFYYLPFSVDQHYWQSNKDFDSNVKQILFIGNDQFRDYEFAEKLSKELFNYNFIFVSNFIHIENIDSNAKVFNSDWKKNTVSDEEIRNLYLNSSLSIIPLKESLQPSGQSVAMQSMSIGVPVLMTKTEGFWDDINFINEENIFLLEKNDITLWKEKVELIFQNNKKTNNVISNARNTIKNEYNQIKMFENFKKIISY